MALVLSFLLVAFFVNFEMKSLGGWKSAHLTLVNVLSIGYSGFSDIWNGLNIAEKIQLAFNNSKLKI